MTIEQRRALFDLICSCMVLALLMYLIGATVGCATKTLPTEPDTPAAEAAMQQAPQPPPPAAARQRPVRVDEQIVRVDSWNCRLMTGPGAVEYTQGGVTRVIRAPFPCPTMGKAKERWGSGTRRISILYNDNTRSSILEFWP